MKSLITRMEQRVEQKYMDATTMDDYNNYVLLTNYVSPIKVDGSNRRIIIYNCSNNVIGNTEYFEELRKYLYDKKNIGYIYNYLLKYNLKNFKPGIVPETENTNDLKKTQHLIL